MSNESVDVQLAQIAGKIDTLTNKLDASMDLLREKIESGDRESVALFRLLEGEQVRMRQDIENHDKRIVNVATEKERDHSVMEADITELKNFRAQAKAIIGLMIFLMPILTIGINEWLK